MTNSLRCEACPPDRQSASLFTCGSLDLPAVVFCPEHYIEHVKGAHGGHVMPGCVSLAAARATLERDESR
jgi:hypothetical protein